MRFLRDFVEPGDLVLLKGSEADQLDMIVREWQPRGNGGPADLRHPEDVVQPVAGEPARHLVVGLGNPEPAYADTPHNIGQRAVDLLAERLGATWVAGEDGLTAVASWQGATLHLAKLHVHVNDTGSSCGASPPATAFLPNAASRCSTTSISRLECCGGASMGAAAGTMA